MNLTPSEQIQQTHAPYRADIDGLRAIAVLSVVFFHAFSNVLTGGFIGVDVFFVISGYLISTNIFKQQARNRFSLADFYARRVKRIFPGLLLVLIATLALGWFALLSDEYRLLGKHATAGALYYSNFVLMKEDGYFDGSADLKPLLHLWSLGVEEQFYIVWPLLLMLLRKWRVSIVRTMLVLIGLSFAWNVYQSSANLTVDFYSPVTRFWELLAGALLAWYQLQVRTTEHTIQITLGKTAPNIISFVGLLLLCLGFVSLDRTHAFPGAWALIPVLGAVCVIYAGEHAWTNRLLAHPVAVWFGLISFPLYLWHWPILVYARILAGGEPMWWVRVAAVLLAVLLAWMTYRFVEQPIRKGRKTRLVIIVLCILMVGVAGFGRYVKAKNGLPSRAVVTQNQEIDAALNYDWKTGFRYHKCFVEVSKRFVDYAQVCEGSNSNASLKLVLWGDSYAASLYQGLDTQVRKSGTVSLHQYTAPGCPPVLGYTMAKNRACHTNNANVIEKIKAIRPDMLVVAGNWDTYMSGEKGGEIVDLTKFKATLNELKKYTRSERIFVVGQLPIYEVDQARMYVRRPIVGSSEIPMRTYHQFKKHAFEYNRLIKEVSMEEGVRFVDPLAILCNASGCLLSLDEAKPVPLSYDKGHLTGKGSNYLVERFFSEDYMDFKN